MDGCFTVSDENQPRFANLKLHELQKRCWELGLDQVGTREELTARLQAVVQLISNVANVKKYALSDKCEPTDSSAPALFPPRRIAPPRRGRVLSVSKGRETISTSMPPRWQVKPKRFQSSKSKEELPRHIAEPPSDRPSSLCGTYTGREYNRGSKENDRMDNFTVTDLKTEEDDSDSAHSGFDVNYVGDKVSLVLLSKTSKWNLEILAQDSIIDSILSHDTQMDGPFIVWSSNILKHSFEERIALDSVDVKGSFRTFEMATSFAVDLFFQRAERKEITCKLGPSPRMKTELADLSHWTVGICNEVHFDSSDCRQRIFPSPPLEPPKARFFKEAVFVQTMPSITTVSELMSKYKKLSRHETIDVGTKYAVYHEDDFGNRSTINSYFLSCATANTCAIENFIQLSHGAFIDGTASVKDECFNDGTVRLRIEGRKWSVGTVAVENALVDIDHNKWYCQFEENQYELQPNDCFDKEEGTFQGHYDHERIIETGSYGLNDTDDENAY